MKTVSVLKCAILLLLLAMPFPASSQQIFSNDTLLEKARNAGHGNAWVDAYGFLLAYVQRDPPEMSERRYHRSILDAVSAAYANAQSSGSGRTKGRSGAAGVSGKGDFAGPASGGPGKRHAFDVPSKPKLPKSYRLRCQGGGRMSAVYIASGETAEVQVSFRKAPKAATNAYPGAGRCAWLDRPLGKNEPSRLLWRSSSRESRITHLAFGPRDWAARMGLTVPKGKRVSLIAGTLGSQLDNLISGIVDNKIFDVACYNNRNGFCVVTRVY